MKPQKLPHVCPVCKKPVTNPHRVYCKEAHKKRAYRLRRALKRGQLL